MMMLIERPSVDANDQTIECFKGSSDRVLQKIKIKDEDSVEDDVPVLKMLKMFQLLMIVENFQ